MSEREAQTDSDGGGGASTPNDSGESSANNDGGTSASDGGSSGQNGDGDDSVGISDDQLPEDLQPTDDNPLAKPPSDEDDEGSGMSLEGGGAGADGAPSR